MRNIKRLFILYLFIFTTCSVFGQSEIDSVGLTKEQLKTAKNFSFFLTKGKIIKTQELICSDFIKNKEQEDLLTILNTISTRFNSSEKVKTNAIKGIPFRNVGTFGHDVNGTYEIKVMYDFYNKQNDNYCSCNIYFTDSKPCAQIKYLEIYDNKKVLIIDMGDVPDIPRNH